MFTLAPKSFRILIWHALQSSDKHNANYFLRTKKNMSQQEAYDFAAKAIYARYGEWESVVAQIPKLGYEIDSQIAKFVELNNCAFLEY
jgi:hypothetical protein